MTIRVSVAKSGLAIAIAGIVTVAAAGCSKNYVRHRRVLDHECHLKSSGTRGDQHGKCQFRPDGFGESAPPSAGASARFVGHWQRHASTLDITSTTATLFAGLDKGPCSRGEAACSETDTLECVVG